MVVDAEKDLLLDVLPLKPFLIKPNNHELGQMFGRKLKTEDEIIECAKELQDRGADKCPGFYGRRRRIAGCRRWTYL